MKYTSGFVSSSSTLNNFRNKTYNSKFSELNEEDMQECTFHPKINRNKSKSKKKNESNNSTVYDRLYTDYLRQNISKDIQIKEDYKTKGEESYFTPKINPTPKQYKSSATFEERLELYKNKYEADKKKVNDSVEKEVIRNCTFTPEVSQSHNEKNKRILSKSLEKFKTRKPLIPIEEKEKIISEMKVKKKKRKVDKHRIETLYKNYQEKEKRLSDLKVSLDEEQGYIYKPKFYPSKKELEEKVKEKFGKNSISERSQQFLDNKEDFIFQKTEEQFSYQRPKRIYTDKEKEQITQNIIKRLIIRI